MDQVEETANGTGDDRLRVLVSQLLERNAQLEQALASRVVIEQAKGALAERWGVSTDQAFELMRRAARSNRMRLRDLAAQVLAAAETPPELARIAPDRVAP